VKSCDEIALQLLVEKSIVAPEALDSLKDVLKPGQTLIEGLISEGFSTEQQILELLAEEFSLSIVDLSVLDSGQIDHEYQDRSSVLESETLIYDLGAGSAKAAIIDPLHLECVDELAQ
jgi:hypothetical protein